MPTKKPRVLIACINCRSNHVRCDAATPKCTRCISLNKPCVYKDLRRRPTTAIQQRSSSPPLDLDLSSLAPIEMPASNVISQTSAMGSYSAALDNFYTYFFPSHPCVLPRKELQIQLDQDPDSLQYLILPLNSIGSCYSKQYLDVMLPHDMPASVFNVQALLLSALFSEWHGSDNAVDLLQRSKEMALEIGLHRRSFAQRERSPIRAETWRRTWWELYVVDAFFAGIRHLPTFNLFAVETDVELPSDSLADTPSTLQEYDDRDLTDAQFSSYAYLVDAARILGTVLAAGDITGPSPIDLVKNAEANLLSWDLHLPSSKRDPVLSDGCVDEVLFRAHLLVHTLGIHLHRPRSQLHYSAMELLCSPYAPPLPAEILSPEERLPNRHTSKAIASAKNLIDLLAVPTSPIKHTPFVMCMGSMAMATHLSACQFLLQGIEYSYAKDRVRVFLGVLKAYDGIWKQSAKRANELKFMAKAVLQNQTTETFIDLNQIAEIT